MKKYPATKSIKTIIVSCLYLINILTIVSCDIQKKRYSRGYTVNWNKKYTSQSKPVKLSIKLEYNDTTVKKSNHKSEYITLFNEPSIIIEPSVGVSNPIINEKTIQSNHQAISKPNSEVNEIITISRKTHKSGRTISKLRIPKTHTNPFAIIAFILSFLFFILLIPLIISIVFSIISLCQVKKQPNNYKKSSNVLAIIALSLDLIIILTILSFIFSLLTGLIFTLLLLLFILLIVGTTKSNDEINGTPKLDSKTKSEKIKKRKNHDKLRQLWINNRLLLFLITTFSAFIFIPLAI